MILIASHIAGHTTPHFARRMGESIPDRFTFAVLIPCTFHLVRGSGGTPEKSFREARFLDDRFGYCTWDGARNLVCKIRSNECCAYCCNRTRHKGPSIHNFLRKCSVVSG